LARFTALDPGLKRRPAIEGMSMMGQQAVAQDRLFYSFNLDAHVPPDHLLRQIDHVLDLGELRQHLAPFYSNTGRPSVDPELMIRMLIIGYCFAIRSERRLCEEVHLNLAYRWFCRLGLEDTVPEHSTFSKNRHGRFRASGVFRWLFDEVVRRCMVAGLVKGEGFAVDASVVAADASRQRRVSSEAMEWKDRSRSTRAVREYLEALDAESEDQALPKNISLTDPQARRTAAPGGPAFYAYSTNYLIDTEHAVIVDVAATTAHRTAEVEVTKAMKTQRSDDTFSSSDFQWDEQTDEYRCPGGNALRREWRAFKHPRTHITKADTIIYRSSKSDCAGCSMKNRCCPNTPIRKIARSVHESARDVARRLSTSDLYRRSRRERKKVEMLFAHLKRILKLDRLRLRGLSGASDEFTLAATAQNLHRFAKLMSQGPPSRIGAPA
jgi:transposase